MSVVSERLQMEPVEEGDLEFYRRFLKDSDLTRWLPVNEPCPDHEIRLHHSRRIAHWEAYGFGTWILRPLGGGEALGYCGLETVPETPFVDLRYGLLSEAQGKGLALEAARAVLTRGFRDLKLGRIYGAAMHENRASVALLMALGMTADPTFDAYGANLFNASVDGDAFFSTLT